ncbi:hypothetical protein VTL71DRAFT_11776 [Oculimacula yallundae]|uniref:Xylanolytic transcriptional activator regulatory domain-containing protein n=1 Tax=Oculimacula yallundae TaxID=86028 RepID=A0ABR4CRP3_9HELO
MAQLVWLVSGCSSGFGEQFARSILSRGDKVIATARRLESLRHLEAAGAAIMQLDITDSQQNICDMVAEATAIHGRIDVLINNASYISIGIWEDLKHEDFLAQFETNVFGTIKLTRAVLPQFRQRRSGTMVFIGSLSGWVGHAGVSAYAGSKFALEGMVEGLWRETQHLGIKTLLFEPGRFRTKLLSSGNIKVAASSIPEYVDFSKSLLGGLAQEDQSQPGDPVKLVEIIVDVVREEGVAKGREIPFRLPLGTDCYEDIKKKCEETLELLEAWESCVRVSRSCTYPSSTEARPLVARKSSSALEGQEKDGSIIPQETSQDLERLPELEIPQRSPGSTSKVGDNTPAIFPAAYFLDSDSHYQISSDRRDHGVHVPPEILKTISSGATMHSVCDAYLRNTQDWLPMLSQKRILKKVNGFSTDSDIGLSLLILCMKLVSEAPSAIEEAASSPIYSMAKNLFLKIEASCLISLQLLQSVILIAVYEIGHGIYPAAYLRVGHAARLGTMMGLHNRKNATQLFKQAETWSQGEEERRTWWTVVVLDRYVQLGMTGVHFAAPDPFQGTLLPCTESHWDRGEIGSNEPFFASSFATDTRIGFFALTCQASHILGLVLRHRDGHKSAIDAQFHLVEAKQLHQTLVALNAHIQQNLNVGVKNNAEIATALCCSARIVLYGVYACNEDYVANRPRLAEESEMQRLSLEGLKEVTYITYQLAQRISHAATTMDPLSLSKNLLVCHSLYQASSECAWFIREDNNLEGIMCLRAIVELLRSIGTKWLVASK